MEFVKAKTIQIVDISKKFDIQKDEIIDVFNLFYGGNEQWRM